jgi:peptidoglycan/LPS O-acetylase OafA/YrhL
MNKNNFDFLRFLFAFVVILSHIIDLSLYPDFLFLKKFFDTHLSVTGFFIISGFIMVYTSYELFEKPKSIKIFLARRILRIVPIYWIYTSVLVFLLFFVLLLL